MIIRIGPPRRRLRAALGTRPPSLSRGRILRSRPVAPQPIPVAMLAERVAALSRSGLPASRLWTVLAAREDACAPVAATVARSLTLGGTVAEGLQGAAGSAHLRPEQRDALGWVAVACAASQASGAPLADVLDGVAAAVRADEDARRQLHAALAGPRATAMVLSWLPLAGIGLGTLTGGGAVTALVASRPGNACLVTGAALWAAGRWWMSRLLRSATDPGWTTVAGR